MNNYFIENPDMILGEMKEISGPFGPETACVPYENQDLSNLLNDAVSNIHTQFKEQENLNSLYDTYTKKYGLISSRANSTAFSTDSSYSLLSSLEVVNEEGKLERKADIFTKRTIKPHVAVTSVDTSNACVDNIYKIWEESKDKKSAQMMFCDLSTPKNEETFSVYHDMKKKLIDKGIPEHEIKFIHEADTETKKKELFAKVRRGDVRVLLGSTAKMGAGTNAQKKLIALHDLDCPWRPSEDERAKW